MRDRTADDLLASWRFEPPPIAKISEEFALQVAAEISQEAPASTLIILPDLRKVSNEPQKD